MIPMLSSPWMDCSFVSFSSWVESICNFELSIVRIEGIVKTVVFFF